VVPRVDEDVIDLPGAAQRRDPDGQPAPGVAGAAEVGLDVDVVADVPAAPDELALVAVELLDLDPLGRVLSG
jgi:hypothetical protein